METTQVPHRLGGFVPGSGSSKGILFSGGGLQAPHKTPRTTFCYRPDHSDLKTQQNIEKACTTPLEEAFRLDVNPSKRGPTFTAWMNDVHRHFLKTGLDSTAYVLKPKPGMTLDITDLDSGTEHFLFDEWGTITMEHILSFDKAIKASPCPIDIVNNRMGTEFLRGSVCLEMKRVLDQELPPDCSAAYMLWQIIHKVQGVNSTAGRHLLHQIQVQRLSKEPAFDVEKYCLKLHTLCKTLTGLGALHVPPDFSILIMATFDTTGIQQFDLDMATMANKLDEDMSAFTWEEILTRAKTKFNIMKNTQRWPPLVNGGKVVEGGFAVELKHIQQRLNKFESAFKPSARDTSFSRPGPKPPPSDTSGDTSCRYCKEKDHILPNCPKLAAKNAKEGKASHGSKSSTGGSVDGKAKHWTKVPPKNPNLTTVEFTSNGTTTIHKWCDTCKRWRSGPKAHLTAEHVRNPSKSTPQANSAAVPEVATYPFGLWSMDISEDAPPAAHTSSILAFFEKHQSDSDTDSDSASDCSPAFLYGDEEFDASIVFRPPYGDPQDWDHDQYLGIQKFIPDWHPLSIADYSIFNTLFPSADHITFDGQVVPPLMEGDSVIAPFQGSSVDMESLWMAAEVEYPQEYEGRREYSFYTDWFAGIQSSGAAVIPMEVDDVPVDNTNSVVPPKGKPRCN